MTTVDPMALMDDAPIELKVTESRAARRARLSTGGLLVGLGVLLAILSFRARGDAAFALSDAFAAVPLPTIVVPGMATALVCGLITAVRAPACRDPPRTGMATRVDTGGSGNGTAPRAAGDPLCGEMIDRHRSG